MQTRLGSERWDLNEIIVRRAVRTLFQPIVHIDSGSIVGFEALSRGPIGNALESAPALFRAARASDRLAELDWLCRASAMGVASNKQLPRDLSWFFNVEPAALSAACPDDLKPTIARASVNLRVILEIVERDTGACVVPLLHATDRARQTHWGIALDDVDQTSVALLSLVQPDVLKLNASLWPASESQAARIVAASCSYAERHGAVVLVEGIESVAQEAIARAHGATFGQGFHYGRPSELPVSVSPPTQVIPLKQRPKPLLELTPFELLSAEQTPRPISPANLLDLSRHLGQIARNDAEADVFLARLPFGHVLPCEGLQFHELSRRKEITVIVEDQLYAEIGHRPEVHPFQPAGRSAGEWTVIVLGADRAAALIAREIEGRESCAFGEFEFVLTYDHGLVAAAGRAFLAGFGLHLQAHSAEAVSRVATHVS